MTNKLRFADPQYDCDIIMKGGITSGIVYPPALAEIATDHRLHGVGGTSAGAIAAAGAAAAELGRDSATGGFAHLETLPDELKQVDAKGRTQLFRLFQPQAATRSTFALIWNFRRRKGVLKQVGLATDLIRMAAGVRPLATPITIVVALALAVGALVLAGPWSLIVGVPLAVIGVIVAGLVRLIAVAPQRLAANYFGLCNGTRPGSSPDPALTDWLHDKVQRLAGRHDPDVSAEERKRPVTFGELAGNDIKLVVLTTNVSRGTSETIPFREQVWAFDPGELGDLFPADVVAHLRATSRPATDPELRAVLDDLGLELLPPSEELPIILAARMSLSFPVLLSAVPLHGLTFERDGDGWKRTFVRNWFSDGGITSNLPVQMFDSVLPRWPTYGINLTGGADPTAANPAANIWRPIDTRQGGLPPTESISTIGGLLGGVFDTMQNWADNENSRAVGFRDRICSVRLGPQEGGMNLDMPPATIDGLAARGACAGKNLAWIQRGVNDSRDGEPTADEAEAEAHQWDRHRWIRFRMAMSGLAQVLHGMRGLWAPDDGGGYRGFTETVSADEPSWQSYRTGWSGVRAAFYREALDREFSDENLSAAWMSQNDPAGFSIGFGPDRSAGHVSIESDGAP